MEDEAAVDAIELNISCPNCPEGGMEFERFPFEKLSMRTFQVTQAVRRSSPRRSTDGTLLLRSVKITPGSRSTKGSDTSGRRTRW